MLWLASGATLSYLLRLTFLFSDCGLRRVLIQVKVLGRYLNVPAPVAHVIFAGAERVDRNKGFPHSVRVTVVAISGEDVCREMRP